MNHRAIILAHWLRQGLVALPESVLNALLVSPEQSGTRVQTLTGNGSHPGRERKHPWWKPRIYPIKSAPFRDRPPAYRALVVASVLLTVATIVYTVVRMPHAWVPDRAMIPVIVILTLFSLFSEFYVIDFSEYSPSSVSLIAIGGIVTHIILVLKAPPALAGAIISLQFGLGSYMKTRYVYIGLVNASMWTPVVLIARWAVERIFPAPSLPTHFVFAATLAYVTFTSLNTMYMSLLRVTSGRGRFIATIRSHLGLEFSLELPAAVLMCGIIFWISARNPWYMLMTVPADLIIAVLHVMAAIHYQQIRQGATCPLTGVWTHSTLQSMLRDYTRTAAPVGLLMVDIDHFKQINDTRGHLEGDRILREVARTIQSVVSRNDIVARYGGEEFGVIIPGVSLPTIREIGERVRVAVETRTGVTVSVGAAVGAPGYDPAALIEAADRALYRSKREGRNRVTIHPEMVTRPEAAVIPAPAAEEVVR